MRYLIYVLALMAPACSNAPTQAPDANAETQSQTVPAAPSEVVAVTAANLAKAYERNEAAAQRAYGGKVVEISGTVRAIQLDLGDEPRVALVVPGQISPINVTFDKGGNSAGIEALEKGAKAIFRCTGVGEILGTPYVEGCSVWQ